MSVSRSLLATTLLIAATAIAGPVWAVFVYKPPVDALAKFEAMAEAACRCRRADLSDGGKDSCWDEFDKIVIAYGGGYEVLACGITGSESVYFPGGKHFIVDQSPRGECNAEERSIIEAIWSGDYDRDTSDQARMAADRRAREAFERGDRLRAPPPGSAIGCGG